MVNLPEPYTTALGIVATGNIKAQLALIAAGISNSAGSTPLAVEAAPKIGIRITVVAVLLVISVRNVTNSAMHNIRKTVLISLIPVSNPATIPLRPDYEIAVPRQIPEPTRIISPQGIWFAVFQSKSFSFFLFPLGVQNKTMTAIKATLASFAFTKTL